MSEKKLRIVTILIKNEKRFDYFNNIPNEI